MFSNLRPKIKSNMTRHALTSLIVVIFLFLSINTVNAKKYKIACLHDYYPYTSVNDQGEASGIIIDWWRLWSEKSGIDIEFIPAEIKNIGSLLVSGEVDIIAGIYFTDERAEQLDFSDPILRLRSVVFLRNELEASDSLKATITLLSNSIAEDKITENYPHFKINGVSSYSLIREEALFRQFDGFVYDIPSTFGKYKGIDTPKGYYEYVTLFSSRLRPAVLKGNKEVLKDVMSGLNNITQEELMVIANYIESESKFVPKHTPSKEALPVEFCFKTPRVYTKDCLLFNKLMCKQECTEDMKIYEGEVEVIEVGNQNVAGGSGGSATAVSVSAPLRVKVQCVAHSTNYSLIYIIIAIIAAILLAINLLKKKKKKK